MMVWQSRARLVQLRYPRHHLVQPAQLTVLHIGWVGDSLLSEEGSKPYRSRTEQIINKTRKQREDKDEYEGEDENSDEYEDEDARRR